MEEGHGAAEVQVEDVGGDLLLQLPDPADDIEQPHGIGGRNGAALTHFHNTTDRLRAAGSVTAGTFAGLDWFAVNSRMVLQDFLRIEPGAAPRTSVVHCGVDPPGGIEAMDVTAPPRLLFVGRLIRAARRCCPGWSGAATRSTS